MKKLLPLILVLFLFGCDNKKQEVVPHIHDAIFIGDSITANWVKESKGHPEFFKENNFLCLGFSGKTSAYLKTVFNAGVTKKRPKQAVILCGTNDIAQNDGVYVSNEEIRDNIAWMASEAAANGIKVVLCSFHPSGRYNHPAQRADQGTCHAEGLCVCRLPFGPGLKDETLIIRTRF